MPITGRCWRTGNATEWTKGRDKHVVDSKIRASLTAAILAALCAQAGAQGIFTCVDAKGRRLTADRPIADCTDREQTELNPSGLPRRKIGPTLTAAELAAQEAKARQIEEERIRAAEDKKREFALLTRYPTLAAHDKERAAALARIDASKASATKRLVELAAQRKLLDAELEFYRAAPAKMPAKLKHQLEQHERQTLTLQQSVAEQDLENGRVNARFDEELGRLKVLWAQQSGPPATVAKAAPASEPRAGATKPIVR
ncbi:MAG: hypothetical protein NVSMB34_11340 [Variovorax sp.]